MNDQVHKNYLTCMTPKEIDEFLKENFPEFGDLEVEEVRLQQESILSFIENNKQYSEGTSHHRQTGNETELTHNESQLALDEALARSLQDLGDDFDDICISEHGGSSHESTGLTSKERPTRGESLQTRQDEVDPDRTTSEELQSPGKSVGSESKGLATDLVSKLPTFEYKTGMFSKKKEKEECVICCTDYKNGVELTMLPCEHHYHSECISKWLQLKTHCPVCQKEMGGQ